MMRVPEPLQRGEEDVVLQFDLRDRRLRVDLLGRAKPKLPRLGIRQNGLIRRGHLRDLLGSEIFE